MLILTVDQQLRAATAAAAAGCLLGRGPRSPAAVKPLSVRLDVVYPEAQLPSRGRVQRLVLTRGSAEGPGELPWLLGGAREGHVGAPPGVPCAVGQGSGGIDGRGQICWGEKKMKDPSSHCWQHFIFGPPDYCSNL